MTQSHVTGPQDVGEFKAGKPTSDRCHSQLFSAAYLRAVIPTQASSGRRRNGSSLTFSAPTHPRSISGRYRQYAEDLIYIAADNIGANCERPEVARARDSASRSPSFNCVDLVRLERRTLFAGEPEKK